MKHINFTIELSDELGIKVVSITHNDTGLKTDSELVKTVAFNLLKSFIVNKDDVLLQDLLREANIPYPMDM